ncbi:MAG: hypothetical protein U0514_01105 [Candidatus Andersenbacteria bacterium]
MVLTGIILVVVGTVTVLVSRYIFENMSRVPWAEDKLGPGGTLTFIRLIGVAVILFGFMLWFGVFTYLFGGIINTLFGSLRPAPKP